MTFEKGKGAWGKGKNFASLKGCPFPPHIKISTLQFIAGLKNSRLPRQKKSKKNPLSLAQNMPSA